MTTPGLHQADYGVAETWTSNGQCPVPCPCSGHASRDPLWETGCSAGRRNDSGMSVDGKQRMKEIELEKIMEENRARLHSLLAHGPEEFMKSKNKFSQRHSGNHPMVFFDFLALF